MGSAERNARFLCQTNRLPPGFDYAVAFVARVRGVNAAFFGNNMEQRENLVVIRIAARRVNKPGRKPQRALSNTGAEHILHALEFAFVRLTVFVSHRPKAERAVADKRLRRHRIAERFDPVEKAASGGETRKVGGEIRMRRNA
ncbi:hypothetical protein SDC9_118341 [bioreactor metagenome]|uniref:Uncharacterized protein n=1 Tax=bioreactor metagenome TaxID=1076179 RepID=A0A645C0P2_9ZZZZ